MLVIGGNVLLTSLQMGDVVTLYLASTFDKKNCISLYLFQVMHWFMYDK